MEQLWKNSLLLLLLAVLAQGTTAPNQHLPTHDPYAYLNGQRVVHSRTVFPKCQDWKRDLVCFDSNKLKALRPTQIFPTGRKHLQQKSVRNYFLLLYCEATTQDYYILLYDTDQGLIRVNIYSNRGALTVTESKNLDPSLLLSHMVTKNY